MNRTRTNRPSKRYNGKKNIFCYNLFKISICSNSTAYFGKYRLLPKETQLEEKVWSYQREIISTIWLNKGVWYSSTQCLSLFFMTQTCKLAVEWKVFAPKKCGYRQTYIQTDRQTYRQTDRQTYRQTDRQTYRLTDLQTYRLTDLQTNRQTDLLTSGRSDS